MSDERRCLVVDGQPVVRLGVRGLLDGRYQVEEASDLQGALAALTDTGGFDIAVVGTDRGQGSGGEPGGLAMIRGVRKAMPGTGIVALARETGLPAASEALDAGACAYVAKSSPPEALGRAIDAAAGALRFIDPTTGPARRAGPLTRRQRQILQLLADGLSTVEAAHRLHLSAETIRAHTKAALARLGARDRTHAVAIGLRSGLIE